jgi:hypothetical protein
MLTYRSQKEGHEGVTDPKTDEADEQDPDEDNPDDEADEQQDTPEQPEQPNDEKVDYEARYKELQKSASRQGAELAIWRRGETPKGARSEAAAEEPDEGAGDDTADDGYLASLEQDSWRAAEALYGETAVEAYTAAYSIFERAQTPADYIAAFEAYHEIRSKGGTPEDAAAAAGNGTKRTRAEAVQPRVDANRSDAGPDLTDDKAVEEARKGTDLGKFVHAATRAMGFSSDKP